MKILKARATGTGRIVSWLKFKKGLLVNQSRFFSLTPTTVIPDVLNDVLKKCKEIDAEFKINIISPNGFTTVGFDIVLISSTFQVNCSRRLARGLFPFNPIAAEFGSNYDVIFTISAKSEEVEQKIINAVLDYKHNIITS